MVDSTDIAIVGAGPAGLAAAKAAAECNINVTVIDEQAAAGGQIYRAIDRADSARIKVLGKDYAAGRTLLDVLDHDQVTHRTQATVWDIAADNTLLYSRDGRAAALAARHIIIATGATERPMPFPGWQLPGVMTAGAGQILLKSSGILPASPTVLAGSGPLLYLLAAQYLRAGQPIAALVETTPGENTRAALRYLGGALRANRYLRKGLALVAEIKRRGLRHYKNAADLQATGDHHVETLSFKVNGQAHRLDCRSLLIHQGVVPNVQLTRMLGIEHRWHALQRCWHPVAGNFGATARQGISVVGDAAGIGGADLATHSGYLAGLHAARVVDALDDKGLAERGAQAARNAAYHLAARPFLDALYAPSAAFLAPRDETIVCRCEEVSAGAIREYVALGCLGPNQTKAFGRCGMGPCQGRFCGLTVAEIIAAERGVGMEEVGYYRIRPPIKPVTLGEIAAIELPGDATDEPVLAQ